MANGGGLGSRQPRRKVVLLVESGRRRGLCPGAFSLLGPHHTSGLTRTLSKTGAYWFEATATVAGRSTSSPIR